MSSPKLKSAMAEIKKVLDKHDIAGLVFLHEPGNGEYLIKVDPSYSVMKPESDGAYRISTKRLVGKEEKQTAAANTANMLNVLTSMAGQKIMHLMEIADSLDRAVGAEHVTEVALEEPRSKDEFYFKGIAKVDLKQVSGKASAIKESKVLLEVSKNLDQKKYLDGDELPTKDGVKPLTIALVGGIYTNIYFAHHKGYWDSAEHLRYAIDRLTELFVQNGKITIGEM